MPPTSIHTNAAIIGCLACGKNHALTVNEIFDKSWSHVQVAEPEDRATLVGVCPNCQHEEACENCGAIGRKPVEVDDSDPAVGYHGTIKACEDCTLS